MAIFMPKLFHGSSKELIDKLGILVDRMSINIELPSQASLKLLAPEKTKTNIIEPMSYVAKNLDASSQRLLPSQKNWSFTPLPTPQIIHKPKIRNFVPARSNHSAYDWC